jgi:hypothetical protein
MNCKQGDLAIFVNNSAGNIGKIVRCLELDLSTRDVDGKRWISTPRWKTDQVFKATDGSWINSAADVHLRPIRDNDGQDEMIRIAGLPLEKA